MRIFSILLFIVFMYPISAFACRCQEQSIQINYERSSMVVYANVQDFIAAPSGEGGTAILAINHWWKSSSPKKIVVNSLTNCSQNFEIGGSYLLFLNMEPSGLYYTDRCLGNKDLGYTEAYSKVLSKLKENGNK
ncbi:hypothetical protein ACL7TT_13395 [Microbulbifer sp. 2304DJ12-6]|uniref:hypothetical protein n=1 Tax=Microbulbifer sp. 2304DJ12-6 TaxID=3233340 RepID=UPI0039AEDB6F